VELSTHGRLRIVMPQGARSASRQKQSGMLRALKFSWPRAFPPWYRSN